MKGLSAAKVVIPVLLIVVLAVFAVVDFNSLGLERRTFVFYNIKDGNIVVEDRMLKKAEPSRNAKEVDIIRYIDETLLGPVSTDLLPLFPRDAKLKSLLYRDGVLYADFSQEAALPLILGGTSIEVFSVEATIRAGSVLGNFITLQESVLRNFSYVKDVRFFIEGQPVYIEELRPRAISSPDSPQITE